MKSRKIALLCTLTGVLLVSAVGLIGCQVPQDPYGVLDPNEADPTDTATNNNNFNRATPVSLTSDSGTVTAVLTTHDVDVYNLGAAAAGDRLVVDVDIPDRILLSASVGIFDSVGRVFYLNQEAIEPADKPLTDAALPAFAPHFEFDVRQATSPLYLAVASQADSDGSGFTAGPYTVKVAFQRHRLIPQPVKQIVAIQFDNALVDYPPFEEFGQWADNPPLQLTGLNGRVLDPTWWRPFVTMQIEMDQNYDPISGWCNVPFMTGFLTFVTTAAAGNQAGGIAIPNVQTITPQMVGPILTGEMQAAIQRATTNANAFTPANLQWFQNNGYIWLFLFGSYLGPGYTAPVQGGQPGAQGQLIPGLNIWNSILAAGYPTAQDPSFGDYILLTKTIRTKLQDMYKGLNVDFLIVGTDPIPTNVPVGHLYLVSNADGSGTAGLASTIDLGNLNQSDFAGIFGGEVGYQNSMNLGLGTGNLATTPSDVMGLLGFVSGHELGHTLGLSHTGDPRDMMSRGHPLTLADLTNTLGAAPLDSSMFPIGIQDSYLLLLLELGMKP